MSDETVNRTRLSTQAPTAIAQDGGASRAIIQPDEPSIDVHAMLALHRAPDSLIAFGHKLRRTDHDEAADPISDLYMVRSDFLASALPHLFDDLSHDAYCTVNGFARPGFRWRSRIVDVAEVIEGQHVLVPKPQWYRELQIPSLPEGVYHPGGWSKRDGYRSARNAGNLRYLNAAFADLDGYKLGLDAPALLAGVTRAQDDGLIPPASALMRSGRGLWVVWLLSDHRHADLPQRAFSDKVTIWGRVMHALNQRLAHLGADANARDAARYCRVPGSVHTGAREGFRRVEFWLQGTRDGMPRYQLADLAGFLQLPKREHHPAIRAAYDYVEGREAERVVDEQRREWGKGGQAARIQYVLADLSTLEGLRGGGFHDGCRHKAAFYLGLFLAKSRLPNGSRVPADDVIAEVCAFGARCRPRLSEVECDKSAQQGIRVARDRQVSRKGSGARGSWPTYDRLIDDLQITDAELTHLRHIRRMPGPAEQPGRMDHKASRHEAIRSIIAECGGGAPSIGVMVQRLEARGFPVVKGTVFNDYRELGIQSTHKGGRPPKNPKLQFEPLDPDTLN